jgi:hypothetical protein
VPRPALTIFVLTPGQKCTAKCDGYFVESAAIEVTCEPATKGATWSSTEEFCGTLNTQVSLRHDLHTAHVAHVRAKPHAPPPVKCPANLAQGFAPACLHH